MIRLVIVYLSLLVILFPVVLKSVHPFPAFLGVKPEPTKHCPHGVDPVSGRKFWGAVGKSPQAPGRIPAALTVRMLTHLTTTVSRLSAINISIRLELLDIMR